MTDIQTLLRLAENLLDTNQFKQAVQLIEHIIDRQGPNNLTLSWIKLAREMDYLVFLNGLMAQHPENPSAHLARISHRIKIGNSGMAIWDCSEAIEKFKDNTFIEMRFRAPRFHVAMRSRDERFIADDFTALWQFHTSEKIRPGLMQDVLLISDPRLKSVFSTLIDSGVFPEEIQTLFRQKLEQFDLLEKLFPST